MNSKGLSRAKSRGITLIELLVVIAIIAILGATTIPVGSGFLIRNNFANKQNELISSLRTAQLNSISGKENRQWGVEISSSTIKMYAVGDSSFDQSFNIPSSLSITTDTIVFDLLTGNPDATANLTISSSGGDSRSISVNQLGVVNVN
jgi:prepilin-type N-terminal cleavage/methylation domain-containing protein